MSDETVFYPLGAGLYAPYDDATVVFFDPGEHLRAMGKDDTQEARAAMYALAVSIYSQDSVTVILVQDDAVLSQEQVIRNLITQRSTTNDS